MNQVGSDGIYRLWAPFYDGAMGRLFAEARQRAIGKLALHEGERVLIPGVGTGLDLPHIPRGVHVVGGDLSPAMLARALRRRNGSVSLLRMDALSLPFPDTVFDALLFHMILSVVPDGGVAFREGWRTLRPGGRAVIFDKFLPEQSRLTRTRRWVGHVIRALGTDPNRRLGEILGSPPDLLIEQDEPSLLQGQYRIVVLRKAAS